MSDEHKAYDPIVGVTQSHLDEMEAAAVRVKEMERENERQRKLIAELLPLARNDRYVTQDFWVEEAEAHLAAAKQGET